METWNKRLAQALSVRGKTQADLVRLTGKKPSSVNGWFTGETKMMEADSSARVCAYLKINALWLFHKMGPSGLEDEVTNNVSEPQSNYVTNPLQEYDEFKRQLLYLYTGMSGGHKEAMIAMANVLYRIDQPNARSEKAPKSAAWDGVERRKERILYFQEDAALPGDENEHSQNGGVSESGNDKAIKKVATAGGKR
jgi:transcriptional regulator with XRE-family HTH domain